MPGVGEKGASQLLQKYGSLDAILDHASEQTPKRREALTEHADAARKTRDLAIIRTDAPVGLDLDDVPPLDYGPERMQALRELFDRFEFGSLIRRLEELAEGGSRGPRAAGRRHDRGDGRAGDARGPAACAWPAAYRVALALTEEGWAVAGDGDEVAVGPRGDGAGAALAASLAGLPVTTHDAKAAMRATADEPPAGPRHDGRRLPARARAAAATPSTSSPRDAGLGAEGTDEPAALDAALVRELTARQEEGLRREGLEPLYREVELPLTRVLAAMEEAGVKLDVHRLGEIAARVRDRADELRDRIWELAGGEFVIDSPKQLGEVLFERLGLPTFRRGKTGWSTDRKVLQLLAGKHPIIELIGQYRELTKLDSTYLSALPELVDEAGRLHTTLAQTVAETGRLSSNNPNLQNIPIRTPLGREIRGAFTTDPGWRVISCDYSQVELRILAHVSGEPALADAFRRGEDIHRATAAEVFGMAPADVNRTTRDRAKAVNFGIVYGISDFGLADQLNIPRADAGAYIEAYLARYPRVRAFIDRTVAAAAQDGFVDHPVRPPPADPRARRAARSSSASSASGWRSTRSSRGPRPTSSRRRWCAPTTPSPRPGCRRA